jgi:adenylate cyclase
LRRHLGNEEEEFPLLEDLRRDGMTDYLAMINRFGTAGAIGMMDCTFSSWATDRPEGFAPADVAALEFLVPCLALAIKSASIARITETLVETYLGRDAGHRVLRGHIERGVAEKISAVLWFSDLQGFTRITDTAPPAQIIPLLNDYADAVVSALHGQGGEVLKFMGDGMLAIFDAAAADDACCQALDAADDAVRRVAALNERRAADGLPVTRLYLGLHVGEVFYGNIGSFHRLDFTVVGPAVNETSRIAALCRSLDQPVLLSSAFAAAAGQGRGRLVSVGRYALRGVRRPQELYTLEPRLSD